VHGGEGRDRTGDTGFFRPVLYQLSYLTLGLAPYGVFRARPRSSLGCLHNLLAYGRAWGGTRAPRGLGMIAQPPPAQAPARLDLRSGREGVRLVQLGGGLGHEAVGGVPVDGLVDIGLVAQEPRPGDGINARLT
jgi:hypothetical protein